MKVTLSEAVLCFLMNALVVSSSAIFRSFQVTDVSKDNGVIPDDGLLDQVIGLSDLQCNAQCLSSGDCVSVYYKIKTGDCRLYKGGLNTSPMHMTTDQGYSHYIFSGGLIGRSCSTASDCTVEFSECRTNDTCGCRAGYSFQRSTHTCEATCSQYGGTFQYMPRHSLQGFDARKFFGLSSLDECVQLCLTATAYTCISFDFNGSTCIHKALDALDVGGSYIESDGWDHYQRNCALIG